MTQNMNFKIFLIFNEISFSFRDLFENYKNFKIHILCHTLYSFPNLRLMTWWWPGEEAETCSRLKKATPSK